MASGPWRPAGLSPFPSDFLFWSVEKEELIQTVLAQVAEQFSRYGISDTQSQDTHLFRPRQRCPFPEGAVSAADTHLQGLPPSAGLP